MKEQHQQILAELDEKATKQYCSLPGRNVVGAVSALVNGKRLRVTITKTRFGFYAAVNYDGLIRSQWARTASGAVVKLGNYLKGTI
jgi:hypothetical protein